MAWFLHISATFLHPIYHGRTNGSRTGEWPPSPMRLFQALTATAFGGCANRDGTDPVPLRAALRWLESCSERNAPDIVAPAATPGSPCTLFVPNNDLDIVARAWAQNKTPPKEPAALKTAKVMRPHYVDDPAQVHFLWPFENGDEPAEAKTLCGLARRIVALGWGIDLVACDGHIVDGRRASTLSGERWTPTTGTGLSTAVRRVPRTGSLAELETRHARFLTSMSGGVYTKPPALRNFREVAYRRITELSSRPFSAFALRPVDPDARSPWRAFRQERAVCVAAMLRHAAWQAAKGDLDLDPSGQPRPDAWRTQDWAEQFVAGHGPRKENGRFVDGNWPRFSYLPLPTIRAAGHADGMIRRVLIAEPLPQLGGDGRSADWAAHRLAGMTLRDEETGHDTALLEQLPRGDPVFTRYTAGSDPAPEWVSVTPVILPGYDDAKREKLLRECLVHAGYDADAIESLEARPTAWLPGCPSTRAFRRPAYLRHLPALHVRIRFHSPTAGPVALGAGRHCGLGVFASANAL
jgi:CRISPR-associated protein Csb2